MFRVDSVSEKQRRKRALLRVALVSGVGFLLTVGLAVILSNAFQASSTPDWVSWLRSACVIMLICFAIGIARPFAYMGAVMVKPFTYNHRVRVPDKDEEGTFRRKIGFIK